MHVALLANTAWLDEELPMFEHLVVGLIDEQVRVVQVVPEGRLDEEASVFGQIVYWQDAGYRWRRRRNLAALHEVLEGLGVNLIHALDGRLWRAAAELGKRNDVPVVYSSFSRLDIPLAARLVPKLDPTRALFTAASTPLAAELRRVMPGSFEAPLFRTGIHRLPQPDRPEADMVALAVAGTGRLDESVHGLLEAAAGLIGRNPNTHFFFDGQIDDQRHLWRAAQSHGLLDHATFVPRRLGHREMLMRADVLVHPQAAGRVRGLTLEAMAHGLPIVAPADPILDSLIDGRTARLVEHTTPEAWDAALQPLIASPDQRAALGESARQWVQQNRLASTSIAQALHAYRSLTGQTIAFAQ